MNAMGLNLRQAASIAIGATLFLFCSWIPQASGEGAPGFCQSKTARAALAAAHGITNEDQGGIALLVDSRFVRPGERVYARLANFGSKRVGYGRAFSIERNGGDWEVDPASPKGPWPKVLGRLDPGKAGRCYSFEVPAQQPLGLYRFSTQVQISLGSRRSASKRFGYFVVEAPKSQFCSQSVLRDYASVFDSLPQLHRAPASGELPFAPPRVYLKQPSDSVLLLKKDRDGRFSYGFGVDGPGRPRFTLNWEIEGRLFRVDDEGQPVRLISEAHRRVGSVGRGELKHLLIGLRVPSQVGLYRANLVFRDEDGRLLGRYGRYLRVIRPFFQVKLAASPRTVRAGASLEFRIMNFGTNEISFGEPYAVERLEETGWEPYPLNLAFHRPLGHLRGGMAGECQTLLLPSSMPAGQYRIKKDVGSPDRSITAEFEVVP